MDPSAPRSNIEKDRILKSSRELIITWVKVNFSGWQEAISERLFKLADKAGNNDDQTRYFQTRDELDQQRRFIQQRYLKHVYQAFDHYRENQHTATDYSHAPEEGLNPLDHQEPTLSLVDNNELEEKLAIGSISRKTTAECSESLYALNQRLSVLRGGKKITDRGNPVAPAVFGEAVQHAITELSLDNRSKILIYKVFEATFMAKIQKLYDLLNHHYESHGVLPHLSYHVKKSRSASISEQLPEELQGQTSEASVANQISLFETIKLLQQQLQPQHYSPRPAGTISAPAAQIIASIQQLQNNAGAILKALETPQAVANSDYQQFRLQAEQQARKTDDVDSHVIEIVGLLFEYMLNDQQLPDSVKALLSYLHTPFLKIAVVDKDFFDHPDHPARQLLNSLVAAGERWVEPTGKHKNDVFLQIKTIVERLLKEFDNDVRLFSELAFEFNHYLRQHARRIRLAEKRAMQAAQGENKLKEIRLKVDGYLKKKIGELALPHSTQTLLFEPWANFLSFNLLRFGSRSEQWNEAAQAVDDIIWYSQPHSTDDWHARKRVQELKEPLISTLRAGFETVGYDSTQGEKLLDALQQRQKNMPTTSPPAAAPITANIDEVDITEHAEAATQSDEVLMQLKKTEFGTWFEFECDSKNPTRVKLAWSNTNTLHFMFVNRMGQQVAVKTGQQLADEIRNGSTKVLSTLESKPFFEKAMERVLEQLRQRQQNNDAE